MNIIRSVIKRPEPIHPAYQHYYTEAEKTATYAKLIEIGQIGFGGWTPQLLVYVEFVMREPTAVNEWLRDMNQSLFSELVSSGLKNVGKEQSIQEQRIQGMADYNGLLQRKAIQSAVKEFLELVNNREKGKEPAAAPPKAKAKKKKIEPLHPYFQPFYDRGRETPQGGLLGEIESLRFGGWTLDRLVSIELIMEDPEEVKKWLNEMSDSQFRDLIGSGLESPGQEKRVAGMKDYNDLLQRKAIQSAVEQFLALVAERKTLLKKV